MNHLVIRSTATRIRNFHFFLPGWYWEGERRGHERESVSLLLLPVPCLTLTMLCLFLVQLLYYVLPLLFLTSLCSAYFFRLVLVLFSHLNVVCSLFCAHVSSLLSFVYVYRDFILLYVCVWLDTHICMCFLSVRSFFHLLPDSSSHPTPFSALPSCLSLSSFLPSFSVPFRVVDSQGWWKRCGEVGLRRFLLFTHIFSTRGLVGELANMESVRLNGSGGSARVRLSRQGRSECNCLLLLSFFFRFLLFSS